MFTTTERIVLFRDICRKPSADDTITVKNELRKCLIFPVFVVTDTVAYQFWKGVSVVRQFFYFYF